MFETHEGLSKLYHVSCPELDLLADVAAEIPGVLGARMMGGGFGGCTINLVKSTEVPVLIEATRKKYLDAFGKEPEYYKVNTGDGAGEII
jgi:galactokinase